MQKTHLILIIGYIFVIPLHAQPFFQDTAVALGINISCGNTNYGNGISFYDFDDDGWDDITLATGSGHPVLFFKNNNGLFSQILFNFTDPQYQTRQINWVDYDNDGDKDLFVTSDTNRNILYRNNGNFVFTDVTFAVGFPMTNLKSSGACWGDYNNDGFLDVFISNRDESFIEPNHLYKNNGDGTFSNVSFQAGILNTSNLSFCAAFFDYNNDGWQDIYVANDKISNSNVLYKNNRDGTFTDASQSSDSNISIDAMNVAITDFNNDGFFDIYITNKPEGNVLLKNNGDETFTNIGDASGTTFNSMAWGAVFLDADNDQDEDLYVSGSLDGSIPNFMSAAFYSNQGDETFVIPENAGFSNDNRQSYSNAIGDFNNDGYPDIGVNNSNNQNIFLWGNQTTSTNNWLKVKLQGTTSNKDGIGSVIEISINGNKQYRYTHCGEGYLAQNSSSELFGLGVNTTVDYVKVKWLSGIVDFYYNVNANQMLLIEEGTGSLSVADSRYDTIKLYPNPVTEVLTIESFNRIIQMSIYESNGKLVKSMIFNGLKARMDVSFLELGMYLLKVVTEEKVSNFKFIKQ